MWTPPVLNNQGTNQRKLNLEIIFTFQFYIRVLVLIFFHSNSNSFHYGQEPSSCEETGEEVVSYGHHTYQNLPKLNT